LRRDLLQALRDNDVDISMGECFMVRPGIDFRDTAQPDLEAMRELGIESVNIVSIDKDLSRATDQCGVLVEMAAALDMKSTLEFGPFMGVSNLREALNILKAVKRPNFRLVLDAMHFFRSGSTVADLKQLDADLIGHIQLCDVPLVCKFAHYMEEARYERLAPGDGELPLREFLAAAPRDLIVGLEIPMLSLAKAGVAPYERLKKAVATTKELLSNLSF
jgi:sugar phosphate isomerase/epimerase